MTSKRSYVELRDLFIEDELSRIGSNKIDEYYKSAAEQWHDKNHKELSWKEVLLGVDITQERYDRYQELLSVLNVDMVQWRATDTLCFYREGFGILDGYYIEIVNTPGSPYGTRVSSVDKIPTGKEGEYFSHLEGDWYLTYILTN